MKDIAQKRKQDLGIFYTPPLVVDFIFSVLNIWKNKQKDRWQGKFPSVVDPACGEGIFLKKAVKSDFTKPPYIWGVDLDEKVKEKWKQITLLKSFGSKAKLDFHFYHQDGLLPLPEKTIRHKKGGMNQHDTVVGNPPYGGVGIKDINPELEQSLFNYTIWRKQSKNYGGENLGLFNEVLKTKEKFKLLNFPIETLFLDRFIQLAKPNGWIAIIIPDGILTNSNSHYVREFITHKTKVEAIISLPRDTFKQAGTSAKTSILFLRKLKKEEKPKESYPVFLASVEKLENDNFQRIVNIYQKFYNSGENNMSNSDSVQVSPDGKIMIRVDKTLKDLMDEKPSSRWDPEYWNPDFQSLLNKMSKKFTVEFLDKYISFITYGQVGQRIYSKTGKVKYIQTINLTSTGINYQIKDADIDEDSHNDPKRSRLNFEDLLLGNAGMGGLGKTVVFLDKNIKVNISQDIDLIRVKNINVYYVSVFLKTTFGQKQIWLRSKGVGAPKLPFGEIKAIRIPVIPSSLQEKIKSEYLKMASYHNQAMEGKKNGNEGGYKTNLETAERMLKDLVKKTEEVIEGKREDVA